MPGIFFHHVREPARVGEIVSVDTLLHIQGNEQFLEGGVPRSFPDSVHRSMELEGPCLGSGDRIGHRTSHIVVAVGTERAIDGSDEICHNSVHL